jgi:glycosyltransferase involved in cell wall biosynthesis
VGDFSDFIAALSRLASNPELCGQFGRAARDAVLQAHAPATVAAQLLAVWHEAANAYRIAMSGEASGEAPESA